MRAPTAVVSAVAAEQALDARTSPHTYESNIGSNVDSEV